MPRAHTLPRILNETRVRVNTLTSVYGVYSNNLEWIMRIIIERGLGAVHIASIPHTKYCYVLIRHAVFGTEPYEWTLYLANLLSGGKYVIRQNIPDGDLQSVFTAITAVRFMKTDTTVRKKIAAVRRKISTYYKKLKNSKKSLSH